MGETGTSESNEDVKKKLINFMETELEKLHAPASSPYIYRVSKEFRDGHEHFFDPISIPIGPLHYDEKSPAQEFKKWFLKNFMGRLETARPPVGKDQLAEEMSKLGTYIRQAYRDIDPQLERSEFVQIMLLDGCFIMELLLSQEYRDSDASTLIGNTEKVPFHTLQQDLLKIENQIPFGVLEQLADLTFRSQRNYDGNTHSNRKKLINLVLKFFNVPKPQNFTMEEYPNHLLQLVMNAKFHKNPDYPLSSSHKVDQITDSDPKTASELELYGIHFKSGDPTNLTKIDFHKGVLTIPSLRIQESTAAEFWNFLIFEMSSTNSRNIFTSYVVLMDTLINSEKDVKILLGSKILVTRNNDVKSLVSLFNDMSANVSQKDFYFQPLIQKVNGYCSSGFRPQRHYLVQNYYDVRWDVLNNVLLFIFTVTQTMFSVLSYNPKGG